MPAILIVDDSKTARMMLKHWVKAVRADLQVLEADNVENALKLAPEIPAGAMAIIDYNMPGGATGTDLAQKLIDMDLIKPQHMTLATANIQDAVRQRAESLGMNYISKPMTPAKVSEVLGNMSGA